MRTNSQFQSLADVQSGKRSNRLITDFSLHRMRDYELEASLFLAHRNRWHCGSSAQLLYPIDKQQTETGVVRVDIDFDLSAWGSKPFQSSAEMMAAMRRPEWRDPYNQAY